MNLFVHHALGHFLMEENDGEGNDLGSEQDEEEQEEQEQESEEEQEDEGEVIVLIGNEKPAEEVEDEATAPAWVKELRKANREDKKRIRELEAQLKKPEQEKQALALGKKPSMDDPDIDYDTEKFEEKLTAWHERKRAIDQEAVNASQQEEKRQAAWNVRMENYATSKTGLKVKDFEDAEENVRGSLNVTQQGIIIQCAKNPALVVYALGKNPKKAAELSGIEDYTKFAYALAELESQLKVQNKKSAPPPERTISGTAKVSGSVDSNLDRLRAEAEKTGDMSKVLAYKRAQKEKARK